MERKKTPAEKLRDSIKPLSEYLGQLEQEEKEAEFKMTMPGALTRKEVEAKKKKKKTREEPSPFKGQLTLQPEIGGLERFQETVKKGKRQHEFGIEMYRSGHWILTHSPGLGFRSFQEAKKRAIQLMRVTGGRYRVVEYDYDDLGRYNVKEYPSVKREER